MYIFEDFFVYYQDENFYYFWKPADLASSRGKSVCFLDLMCNKNYNTKIKNIVKSQEEFFGKEKELGLLNRLDGVTTGLLYFAKSPRIYKKFHSYQKEGRVNKYYVAVVYGNISNRIYKNGNVIKFPIMHHRFSDDRMVVVYNENDKGKGKGKIHQVKTEILEVEYDDVENISIVMLKIHKGIRHQIRIHLSSIGYPICGDELYCKSKSQKFEKLQLFSVGMEVC